MNGNGAALVSVCMPVYNGERTLRQALDSLVCQTWPDMEIIICDDGSSDQTVAICREFAERHDFIHFEVNAKNLGADARNFRKTLSLARGKYCFWASQDDIWHPEFIRRLSAILEADPQAVAAMCATEYFIENKGRRETLTVRIADRKRWPQFNAHLLNAARVMFQRGHASQLRTTRSPEFVLSFFICGIIRTDYLRDTFAAIPGPLYGEQQLVSQLALAGKLVYLDEVLFFKEELNSFCSIDIPAEQLDHVLDKENLEEHRRRRARKRGRKGWKPSKLYFASQTLYMHLKSGKIPLTRKWQSVVLIAAYMLRRLSRPVTRMFKKAPANRTYNLLQNNPEKSKRRQT